MKSMLKIAGVAVVVLMMSSCVVHEHHGRRMPPGHAKRYYAPGQVKKVYIYDDRGHHHKGRGHGHHR